MRNVPAKTIQMDEIWSFCGAKSRNIPPEQRGYGRGDLWTWVALDPETKLVLSWLVGPRSAEAAEIIADDLKNRLANRVQISTDGYNMYPRPLSGPSDGTAPTTPFWKSSTPVLPMPGVPSGGTVRECASGQSRVGSWGVRSRSK